MVTAAAALYHGVQYTLHAGISKRTLLLGSHKLEIQQLDPACSRMVTGGELC